MRKDFGSKPYLYPQLVMIIGTYDKDGNPNAMNAAWGGLADYNKVMVCMSSHKTTKNIEYTNEFTISIADDKHVIESDYVGIVSQNKEKLNLYLKSLSEGLPGGSVVKKPPASTGDMGSIPEFGRSHRSCSNWACVPQLSTVL